MNGNRKVDLNKKRNRKSRMSLTLLFAGTVFAILVAVLIVVGLAALFYLLLLAALRAMPREDVVMLPGGEKLAKILKIR